MKLKKIISMGCAMALISAGIVLPAGAADVAYTVDPDTGTNAVIENLDNPISFDYTGKVEQGTIKVTVKTSGAVYINPYNIEVTSGSDTIGTDSVISPVQYIKNESNTALGVSIKGKATKGASSDAVLTTKADMAADPAPTGKNVSLVFEIMETDTDTPAADAAPLDWTEAKSVDIVDKADTLVDTELVLAKPVKADESSPLQPTYAAFRVTGDAVAEPKTTDTPPAPDPWTANDKVDVKLSFTFTPNAAANGGGSSASAAEASLTADMTTVPYPGSATLTAALDGATIQSVTWSCSNANGSISGSGNTVSVANVNIGTCTVTAVITDTAGKTYTKTIDLTMQ